MRPLQPPGKKKSIGARVFEQEVVGLARVEQLLSRRVFMDQAVFEQVGWQLLNMLPGKDGFAVDKDFTKEMAKESCSSYTNIN